MKMEQIKNITLNELLASIGVRIAQPIKLVRYSNHEGKITLQLFEGHLIELVQDKFSDHMKSNVNFLMAEDDKLVIGIE